MTIRQPALVTTIIPTFNRADEVCTAVRSALAQTHARHEVIVVDDGSTDGTHDVLANTFGGRIRYVHQRNAGVSAARNTGASHAHGELLAFLDSDDQWTPNKLELQVAYLAQHTACAMVVCDVQYIDREHRPTFIERRRDQLPTDGDVLRWVVRNPALTPSTVLVRRHAFDEVMGFDTSLPTAEDLDFHLRFARRFGIGVVPQQLTRCMRGNGGLSSLSRTHRDYLDVVTRFLDDPSIVLDRADRLAALFNAYLQAAKGLLWDGDLAGSLEYAGRAALCVRSPQHVVSMTEVGGMIARNAASRSLRRITGTSARP